MRLTQNELQRYADELPIGYYANTRLSVKIDADADTSYFMPSTREIFISLKGVNDSIKGTARGTADTEERAVRAHLYHELSHAILTPKDMQNNEIRNVFEDERIETLLRSYYHKVNFRDNVKALCGYDGKAPTTDWEKYYFAVRFRVAPKDILNEIDRVIYEYSDLNWNSNNSLWSYYRDIDYIYYLITQKQYSEQEWSQLVAQATLNAENCGEGDVPTEYADATAEEGNGQENEGEGECGHSAGEGNPIADAFENAINNSYDFTLYNALETILQSFQKKNVSGSSIQAYSGRMNPRNCARNDYRYFDRQATVNSSNPYGTFHLNLFVDNSGSFSSNAAQANKIMATLCLLESRYNFFTVDFAFCGDSVEHKNHNELYLMADEGTAVDEGAFKVFKSMQKKNTVVYNLVLYDGDAYKHHSGKYVYEPFDTPNTTLILDTSCQNDAKVVKNAKVIISNQYLSTLNKNIVKTLRQALR